MPNLENKSNKKNIIPTEKEIKHQSSSTDDEPVIVIDSKLWKRRWKGRSMFIIGILVGIGLVIGSFYLKGLKKLPKKVLLTNVFLRIAPQSDASKVIDNSIKMGETLSIIKKEGDWYKLKTERGIEGYMKSDFLVTEEEYDFINGMIGNIDNEKGKAYFVNHPARYKLALLSFFKKNEWVSKVDEKVENAILGDLGIEREMRQVHTFGNDAPFNTMVATDLTGNGQLDFACLIRGDETEQLFIQTYDNNNEPSETHSYTLEGIGYEFKVLVARTNPSIWVLGDVEAGVEKRELLSHNALLLSFKANCHYVYHFKEGVFMESPQQDCF